MFRYFRLATKRPILALLPLLFSISSFAGDNHLYLGASFAGSWAELGNSSPQITYDGGNLSDVYPLTTSHASSTTLSVNGGYEFAGDHWKPAIALGIGIYHNPTQYNFTGQLIETAVGNPSTGLYSYKYSLITTRIMAEAQFSWMIARVIPFINIGLGSASNKMVGYTETPITPNGFVTLSPFGSKSTGNLSYQLGFGLGTAFNFMGSKASFKHERLALGYRYVNLGATSFASRGPTYPYTLQTGNLTTNDVYLSFTHLF